MDENAIRWEPLENGIWLPRDPHFPYTRDVTLLCDLVCSAFPDRPMSVLDLGCGSGAILFLLAARRESWTLTGIERRKEAAALAEAGAERNHLQNRAEIVCADLRTRKPMGRYDLAVANPPYRVGGKPSPDPLREQAVGETDTTLTDFCRAAYRALKPGGSLVLIFPIIRESELNQTLTASGFADILLQNPAEPGSRRLLCTARKADKEQT